MALYCILPAAGSGERLKSETAGRSKLLLELETQSGTISVISLTVRQLLRTGLFERLIIPIPQNSTSDFESALVAHRASIDFVIGGATRHESVLNALAVIPKAVSHIAVHDAARPFVSEEALRNVVRVAVDTGAALLVERITSTLKHLRNNEAIETLNREAHFLAQTPQIFSQEILRKAYSRKSEVDKLSLKEVSVNDDSELVERLGIAVKAVINNSPNPKITAPADLSFARYLAKQIS